MRFDKAKHLEKAQEWAPGPLRVDRVPETGYIDDVQCVFLYPAASGKFCWIDSWLIDPHASKREIVRAMHGGVIELLGYVRELDCKTLIIPSRFPFVTRLFARHCPGISQLTELCYFEV